MLMLQASGRYKGIGNAVPNPVANILTSFQGTEDWLSQNIGSNDMFPSGLDNAARLYGTVSPQSVDNVLYGSNPKSDNTFSKYLPWLGVGLIAVVILKGRR